MDGGLMNIPMNAIQNQPIEDGFQNAPQFGNEEGGFGKIKFNSRGKFQLTRMFFKIN